MSEESDPVQRGLPHKQGLYDPQFEHDSCGAGFVVNIKGGTSHGIGPPGPTTLGNPAPRGAPGPPRPGPPPAAPGRGSR